jgi:hypothetical protein
VTNPERRRAANQANAVKSTGPRSDAGKARSARNALRHGLSVPVIRSVENREVDDLAQRLSGGDPDNLDAARTAAEVQLELCRIRGAKDLILMKAIGDYSGPLGTTPDTLALEDMVSVCLANVVEKLITLEGYERKALSRRKAVLRALYC